MKYAHSQLMVIALVVCAIVGAGGSARIHAQQWVSQGPGPTRHGQVEGIADGEVVGAVNAIAAHPTDANIVYVGAVNGGIWRTTNARAPHPTWIPQTDDRPSLAIGALAFDPTDPNHQTLVAGVGNASSMDEGGPRRGLLRTIDGGAHWTSIETTDLTGLNVTGVAPRGPTIVIAVNDATLSSRIGIWRSTDTGARWRQISAAPRSGLPAGGSTGLAADPVDGARLFTLAGRSGIYRSVDTGETWTKVSNSAIDASIGTAGNVKLAVGADHHVYAAIVRLLGDRQNTDPQRGQLVAVFHSTAGDAAWTKMDLPATTERSGAVGIHPGRQGTIHLSLAADRTNGQIVYIGGDRQPDPSVAGFLVPNSIGASDYSGRLFRGDASKPTGQQWVHLTHSRTLGAAGGGTALGSAPHADSRAMALAPDGSLIEGDDGGVYRRTNPASNAGDWVSMNGDLRTTEFHSVAWDANTRTVIGGAQDTGSPEQDATNAVDWDTVLYHNPDDPSGALDFRSTSDGGVVAVDTTSAPPMSVRYSSWYGLGRARRQVFRADGAFESQSPITLAVSAGQARPVPQFYTPLRLNRVHALRLVVGEKNGVYESFDQGETASPIGPAVAANRNGLAYGAADNHDALYVASGAAVYVRMTPDPAPLDRSTYTGGTVAGVAMDPQHAKIAFVVDEHAVRQTKDSGTTWTQVTGNLASLEPGTLRSIAYSTATTAGAVLVGSDSGVFEAAGPTFTTWQRVGRGLPHAPVLALEFSEPDRTVLAGTLGRGAWTLTLAPPPVPTLTARAPAGLALTPVQAPRPPLAPPSGGGISLSPGVLIDTAGDRVIIGTPDRSIEAVRLRDGARIWLTRNAALPIGLARGRVVAQMEGDGAADVLRVAVLDAATGAMRASSLRELSGGIRPAIDETTEGRFVVVASPAAGDALLTWEYEPHTGGGVAPGTPDALRDPVPGGGATAGGRGAAPAPALPQTGGRGSDPSAPLEGAFRLNLDNAAVTPAAMPAAPRLGAFAALDAPAQLAAPAERLPSLPRTQMLSADRRHVLAAERIGDDTVWDKYRLTVYERTTGRPLGSFASHYATTPFYVSDSTVVYETPPSVRRAGDRLVAEPLKVRALDLGSGRPLWERDVRDTSLRRAPPP